MSRTVRRSSSIWIVLLLLLGAAQIVHRTPPVKPDSFLFDFSNVYSASRVWLEGGNPFDIAAVYRAWDSSHHGPYLGSNIPENMARWAAVYPPPSLLIIAPFAALPANWGHLLWTGLSIVLLILATFALFALSGLTDARSRLLFVACAFASAPLQCAFESGQPALPACALVILAVWAFAVNRMALAGVLLGLATALKVQIGLPFVIYYLFIGRCRVGTVAMIVFAVASLVAVGRMEALGITGWWTDWQRNMTATLQAGAINDPRPGGPFRNDMVNLQTVIDVFVHRQICVDLLVLLIFLPLVGLVIRSLRRDPQAGTNLLALSLVAALSMLPVYRRLYDGVTLLMLLAWAIAALKTSKRGSAVVILLLLSEFLLPIDLIPFVLRRTHVFDVSVSSTFWQGFVVPHHAWGLLVLAIGSACVFLRSVRKDRVAPLMAPPRMFAGVYPANGMISGLRASSPSA